MKRVTLIVLAVAVLAFAGYHALRFLNRDQSRRLLISGNIELMEVKIAFKTSGKLLERTVDEGDMVKKGMLIARLDSDQLQRQRERELAALAATKSQYEQLQTAIAYQREATEGEIQARTADVSQTDARLRELVAGSRPQEIQEGRAAVDAMRTETERARKDWERAQALYKNEDISSAQYDQFRMQHERTEANLRQAEQKLALIIEGPRKEQIDGAQAQVARAKAALRLAEAGRLELKRRQQELETRRAEIDRAQAQIEVIDSQLKDTEVHSPVDGVVLVKSVEVGETVAAGTTVVSIGDIERPWLRGYINEQDLGRVKLGTRSKVTTDSFPGKAYEGRVSFISSQAEFTPKQIQTPEERVKLVYRIKIDIPNPSHELKSNMPADAEILVGEAAAK